MNDEGTSKYLNNFERITNASSSSQEATEFYDPDEQSIASDLIYPDPRSMVNVKNRQQQNDNNNNRKSSATSSTSADTISNKQMKKFAEMSATDREHFIRNIQTLRGNDITQEDIRNEDLKEHDIIDSIMYIYYGSNVTLKKNLGGSVIIAGTVFALAAQILAIVFFLLRNR